MPSISVLCIGKNVSSTGNLHVLATASTAFQTQRNTVLETWLPASPLTTSCQPLQPPSSDDETFNYFFVILQNTETVILCSFTVSYCNFCYCKNCKLFCLFAFLRIFCLLSLLLIVVRWQPWKSYINRSFFCCTLLFPSFAWAVPAKALRTLP